jgi:hypothetical protein
MKTEDNGYRLIVHALGNGVEGPEDARSAEVYRKLGLDSAIEPSMSHQEPWDYLTEYGEREGVDETQVSEWYNLIYEPWTLDQLPMMRAWLEENGPALDLLGKAVRTPAFCMPLTRADSQSLGLLAGSLANDLQRMRSFARSLSARANHRIATGDVEGAIDDVVTCERLGRHMQRQGPLLARLVGIAIEGIADAIGIAALREFQPTEGQFRRLVSELDSLPPRPNLKDTLLVARYDTLACLQTIAAGEESLAALFSVWEGIDEYRPPFAGFVSVDWNVVMRRVNERFDNLDQAHGLVRPKLLSPGNLFLNSRSQRVADAVAVLCTSSLQAIREANRRSQCVDNFQRITLAMLIYEREHGVLPPAWTVDAEGKALHSWRVLLLPYLGEEELHGRLRLDEPWDSKHNRQFQEAAPAVYQCPSAQLAPGQTTYSVVIGENTAFRAKEGRSLEAFGMNLLLVTERQQPICWMDPTLEVTEAVANGWIYRQGEKGSGLGSLHPGGMNAGYRDASTRFLTETIEASLLQGLLDGTAEKRP